MLIKLSTRSRVEIRCRTKSQFMKIDNSSFERRKTSNTWEQSFKKKKKLSIQEEIKSRLMSGNACYHLVQNLLSYTLLSNNTKIKIPRTIFYLFFCTGVKLGCSHWGRNAGSACLRIGCRGEYLGLRGMRWQGSGGNYIMRSLIICTPHSTLFEWSNRE